VVNKRVKQRAQEDEEITPTTGTEKPGKIVAEIGLWGWAMALLGYFYYSNGYFTMLSELWTAFRD